MGPDVVAALWVWVEEEELSQAKSSNFCVQELGLSILSFLFIDLLYVPHCQVNDLSMF